VKAASVDALDAVKARTGRICPLICETGFRADVDKCVKIICRKSYEPNDEGTCEKVRKPIAERDEPKAKRERVERNAAPARPQASGQIVCGHSGCRQVRPGCRIVGARSGIGVMTADGQMQVCN